MQALSAPTARTIAKPASPVPDARGSAGQARRPRVNRRAVPRRPLPDAVAIRSVIVPDPAPPYDAAGARAPRRTAPAGRRQPKPGSCQGTRTRLTVVSGGAEAGTDQAGSPARAPAAGTWPSQFAQVLAETLAGTRPPEQIMPWTTEQTRKRISQLGPLLATAHRPRVRRVIVTSPARGVLEMTVIVGLGASVRALAVRLERSLPSGPGAAAKTGQLPSGGTPGTPAAAANPVVAAPGQWLCTAVEAA